MYADKVRKGWDLALKLRGEGDLNNSASRMYYAVFQAVLAYAIQKEGFDREKARRDKENVHSLMKRVVEQNVKNSRQARDTYEDLRELRNRADYDPDDVVKSDLEASFVYSVEGIKDFFLKKATK
jgi:uncharacterized protein (UPF0332 family)